mmetsp:Transcript_35018/g.83032  ORF Transcript_35018/g.83032 Transcript_35018/m.83032 type:complete len:207 (-) Transcript_35018:69-689(-)
MFPPCGACRDQRISSQPFLGPFWEGGPACAMQTPANQSVVQSAVAKVQPALDLGEGGGQWSPPKVWLPLDNQTRAHPVIVSSLASAFHGRQLTSAQTNGATGWGKALEGGAENRRRRQAKHSLALAAPHFACPLLSKVENRRVHETPLPEARWADHWSALFCGACVQLQWQIYLEGFGLILVNNGNGLVPWGTQLDCTAQCSNRAL